MFEDGLKTSLSGYLPLRDVVFNALREAILRGELKPGERLMEKQLAEKMGVSRTPIREAIRKLELEGFVVMIPRKGAQVAEITEKEIKDVLEVRAALEELAVQIACKRIEDEDIEELKKVTVEFNNAIIEGKLENLAEIDVKFHDIIFRATGNEKLQQIINNLREQLFRYRLTYLRNKSYHEKIKTEHEAIIKYLEEGNVEKVSEVALDHIRDQEKIVIRMVKQEQ